MTGNTIKAALAVAAAAALAGCASSGAPAHHPASTITPPAAAVTLDPGTAGVVCAGVNALEFAGDSGSVIVATVATAHRITPAQVVYAIDHRCPQLKADLSGAAS